MLLQAVSQSRRQTVRQEGNQNVRLDAMFQLMVTFRLLNAAARVKHFETPGMGV
jgi:hypothetical protein